jgi:hypothetical protein
MPDTKHDPGNQDPGNPHPGNRDAAQDAAVAGTFPASDPPASMASGAARAVPAESMTRQPAPVPGAVTLRRDFAEAEAAKLALEGLVRDGPVDRAATAIRQAGSGCELVIQAPPEDADRLRRLLAAA